MYAFDWHKYEDISEYIYYYISQFFGKIFHAENISKRENRLT